MKAIRGYLILLFTTVAVNGCIPTTSKSFSIAPRPDPLSDVQALEQLCRDLGLTRVTPIGPPEPPKGAVGCDSAPYRGYFIVFSPEIENKKIDVYFAERAHAFSDDAKAAYSNLVRGLKKQFGDAAINAPTI